MITEALHQGYKITIIDLGNFEIRDRSAHEARNPHSGGGINIDATKSHVFKAGKGLKDSVNHIFTTEIISLDETTGGETFRNQRKASRFCSKTTAGRNERMTTFYLSDEG